MRCDRDLTAAVRLDNFHLSGEHYEERDAHVAWLEENFSGTHISYVAKRAGTVDLCRRQRGKYLCVAIEATGRRP